MSARGPLLASLVSLLLVATEARAASARVTYVGGRALYLDRGRADGLLPGSVVSVSRRGRALGACTVEDASDHRVSCRIEESAQPAGFLGGIASFEKTPAKPAKTKTTTTTTTTTLRPSGRQLAAGRELIAGRALPKVVFTKKRVDVIGARASAVLRGRAWASAGNESAFVRPSIDVGARAPLPGLVAGGFGSAALRVQGDVLAPGNLRVRSDDVEVYVWDAELGLAGAGPVVGALGRFRPRKVPGVSLIDGAQVGLRGFGGALEVGAWAGAVPDLVSVAPSFQRMSGGVYGAVDVAPIAGLLVLPRARVGLLSAPDLRRTRAEAEADVVVQVSNVLSVGASSRVALLAPSLALALDTARVDVDLVPWRPVQLRAGWRYVGAQPGDLDTALDAPTPIANVRAGHHGDLSVAFAANEALIVSGTGGVAVDEDSGAVRGFVGPEVTLPRLFGDGVGGVSLGALEEPATRAGLGGRSAWVQTTTKLLRQLSWSTRVSYFEHHATTDALREVMVMSFVDAPVLPWLTVRGRAHGLVDLPAVDGGTTSSLGLFCDVGVSGAF
ncbi:MAG: hypothetical protein Q8O67_21880 [Deltaproteobacteria bacterium]|nr:hypothetical protein [Deltaproteobacteria bacterium]